MGSRTLQTSRSRVKPQKKQSKKNTTTKPVVVGAVLSKAEILEEIAAKRLIFDPPLEEDQIGPASIDLRLGLAFTKINEDLKALRVSVKDGLAPLAKIQGLWAYQTLEEKDAMGHTPTFALHSKEFVLALTHEYVTIPPHLIAMVEGRSTYARVGLSMHQTAPWIQPGFEGNITLEIMNHGPLTIDLTPLLDRPRAASERWSGVSLPRATHSGVLTIGEAALPCYVLEGGERVLSTRGIMKSLGRTWRGRKYSGTELPVFLEAGNLKPFISGDLGSVLSPINFKTDRGAKSEGFRAEILPVVCETYLSARDAKALTEPQLRIAKACEILVRALSRIAGFLTPAKSTSRRYILRNPLQCDSTICRLAPYGSPITRAKGAKMIRTSKQVWEVGEMVKVGSKVYRFVPHNGLERLQ